MAPFSLFFLLFAVLFFFVIFFLYAPTKAIEGDERADLSLSNLIKHKTSDMRSENNMDISPHAMEAASS